MRLSCRRPHERRLHQGFGVRPGNERLGTHREVEAEERDPSDEVLQRASGGPVLDEPFESRADPREVTPRRVGKGRSRERREFSRGPADRVAKEAPGVEAGGGDARRGQTPRRLRDRAVDRIRERALHTGGRPSGQSSSAASRSVCSFAWSGSISGSSSPASTAGSEWSVSAIRWSVIRFSLKL